MRPKPKKIWKSPKALGPSHSPAPLPAPTPCCPSTSWYQEKHYFCISLLLVKVYKGAQSFVVERIKQDIILIQTLLQISFPTSSVIPLSKPIICIRVLLVFYGSLSNLRAPLPLPSENMQGFPNAHAWLISCQTFSVVTFNSHLSGDTPTIKRSHDSNSGQRDQTQQWSHLVNHKSSLFSPTL